MTDRGDPFITFAEACQVFREGLRSDMLRYAERLGEPCVETPTAEQVTKMVSAYNHFLRLMEVLYEDGLLPSEDDEEEDEEDDEA